MLLRDKVYKDLAIKYNLSVYQIELICEAPFLFLKNIMQEGKYESLMLPYWGKYMVKPYRKKKIQNDINKRNNRRMVKLDMTNSENREDVQKKNEDM